MGTTLALTGAYNLAGALMRHPDDCASAFAAYEQKMRPTVDRAQKLAPGAPKTFAPRTPTGIFILHLISFLISWSGLMTLVAMLAGPPANAVPVEDYGFKQLPEWRE